MLEITSMKMMLGLKKVLIMVKGIDLANNQEVGVKQCLKLNCAMPDRHFLERG